MPFCLSRTQVTPTKNILAVTGKFTGELSTNSYDYSELLPSGIPTEYAYAFAQISTDPEFPAFEPRKLNNAGIMTINQPRTRIFPVSHDSLIGFSGSVESRAYAGIGALSKSTASANLSISAALTGQNSGTVDYLVPSKRESEPEPEPETQPGSQTGPQTGPQPVPLEIDSLSVIGSTVLFSLGIWRKRKLAQKQINKEEKNENL